MRRVKGLIKKYKKRRVNYQKISKDKLEKINILAERNDITSEMSTEAIIFGVSLFLIGFLFLIYSVFYNSSLNSSNSIFLKSIMTYLTISILVTFFFQPFNPIQRFYRVIRVIISIIFILIPYANHFKELTETKPETQNELIIPLVFFLSFCLLIEILLILKRKSKTSFHFKYEVSDSIVSIVSAIVYMLSILTIFYNPDWETRRIWTTLFVLMMIFSEVLKNVNKFIINKGHEIAQKIFQEQLLLEKPRYEELKECYYHGGDNYKEKLLSTEKFLEVVVKNELKSLKDLKTYDDYRLYKAYKGRS